MSDWISIDPLPQMLTPTQEYIKEQLADGKTPTEIAKMLYLRREHIMDEIYEIRKKECTVRNRLSDEQKAQILEMREQGKTSRAIADVIGCSQQTVLNIINAEKLKTDLEAEQAQNLPETKEEPESLLETKEKPENLLEKKASGKPAKINKDFDDAVTLMIEESRKNDAIAEKNSDIAEAEVFEQVPDCVIKTIKQRIQVINNQIERNFEQLNQLSVITQNLIDDAKEMIQWTEAHQ